MTTPTKTKTTTVQVFVEDWHRLAHLRTKPGEPMRVVINRLLDQAERLNVRPGKREGAAEAGR